MKRSKFSLSNYKLGSSSMGELVPVGLHEVLPGDSFQHATSVLLRCSPLVSPVMHPVHVRIHHWFVLTVLSGMVGRILLLLARMERMVKVVFLLLQCPHLLGLS